MKVYEFLCLFRDTFTTMARNGISQDDAVYIDLCKEYAAMLSYGRKEAEILVFLSSKYKLQASTIKKAVKRLNEEFNL